MLLVLLITCLPTLNGYCVDFGFEMTCTNDMDNMKVFPDVNRINLIDVIPQMKNIDTYLPKLNVINVLGSSKDFCLELLGIGYDVLGCEGELLRYIFMIFMNL